MRLILSALGEVDFGIYNLVGGMISMLTFINTSLSHTSVRYLSIRIGERNQEEIRKTFNDCFWLHFILAIIIVVVLEALEIVFFNYVFNIPSDRVQVAKLVYQCMVLTFFIKIVSTPFSALVTSHEKFVYSSILGICSAVVKFIIALILVNADVDRLALYGYLMAAITVIEMVAYILYLISKFEVDIYFSRPAFSRIRNIIGFAGWTTVDTIGNVASRQGYPIILNSFLGVTINTAYAIARQVSGYLYTLSSTCVETIKPQIIQSYGASDNERMLRLSLIAGKFGITLMSFVSIPLLVMTPYILDLWLDEVPDLTVVFTRLLILTEMAEQLTKGIFYAGQAIGRIKWLSLSVAIFRLLGLPVAIVFCMAGCSAVTVLYVFLACELLASLSRVVVLTRISELRLSTFLKQVFFRIVPTFLIAVAICFVLFSISNSLLWAICTFIITSICYALITYLIGLSSDERHSLLCLIHPLVNKMNIIRKSVR